MESLILQLKSKYEGSFLESIYNFISNLQSIWACIIFITVIFLSLFFAISFIKNVNKKSTIHIGSLVENGKYIPELYVELNNIAEQLRYFGRPRKFRKKLIREFNGLFNNTFSRKLSGTINENLILKLKNRSTYREIQNAIENNLNVFERYMHGGYKEHNDIGEFYFIIEFSGYYYERRLNELLEFCIVANQKSVILNGSAGNGKTNLLCDFS